MSNLSCREKCILYGAMPSDASVGMQKGSLWHDLLLECVWKFEVESMYRLSSTHVSVASLARESPNLDSSWLSEFALFDLRVMIGWSRYRSIRE